MRIKIIHITPLLAAGAAAVAIVAAPTAMAATTTTGPAHQSTSLTPNAPLPGNVQINDSLGPVQYSPQYPYDEGDYIGGYGAYGHHGFVGGFGGHGGGHRR